MSVISGDFCQDYSAVKNFVNHKSIYSRISCPKLKYDAHPPFSVLFFYPFEMFSLEDASLIWSVISLSFYIAAGIGILQTLKMFSIKNLSVFLSLSILWSPLFTSSVFHNLNQILLFLLVSSWIARKKNNDLLSGLLLGVAALIKIWPAVLIIGIYILGKKKIFISAIFTCIVGVVTTLVLFGPKTYKTYLGPVRIYENAWISNISNTSLSGLFAKLFVGSTFEAHGIPLKINPLLLQLPSNITYILGYTMSLIVVIIVLIFIYRYRRFLKDDLLIEGVMLTTALLAFPVTFDWNIAILLLPLLIMVKNLEKNFYIPFWWYVIFIVGFIAIIDPFGFIIYAPFRNLIRLFSTFGIISFLLSVMLSIFYQSKALPEPVPIYKKKRSKK